jgi:methylmalonyl-CoA/ethylmalonyl-CoA epimerase
MPVQFDHVGIVVNDTHETLKKFSNLFGFIVEETQTFPEQGFKSTIAVMDMVRIEFIEPIGEAGIIQNFIAKHGYGLHHISLRVDDIVMQIEVLKEKGALMINDKPVRITDESSISFLHPTSTAGVLIELIHRADT